MKNLFLSLSLFISVTASAQTYNQLPSGSKPYGNQPYLFNGNILMGTPALTFRLIPTKEKVDSALALKAPISPSGAYIQASPIEYQTANIKLNGAAFLNGDVNAANINLGGGISQSGGTMTLRGRDMNVKDYFYLNLIGDNNNIVNRLVNFGGYGGGGSGLAGNSFINQNLVIYNRVAEPSVSSALGLLDVRGKTVTESLNITSIPSNSYSDFDFLTRDATTGEVKKINQSVIPDMSYYQSRSEKGQINGYASLDASGKVPLTQVNDVLLGAVNYQGNYNASNNTPALPTAEGNKGKYFVVTNGGAQQGLDFNSGDWIISNGTIWEKVDNNNKVASVNGRIGAVSGLAEQSSLAAGQTIGANTTGSAALWKGESFGSSTAKNVGDVISWNGSTWYNKPISAVSPITWNNTTSTIGLNTAALKTTLGVGDGSTLNNNISGNATSATKWGNFDAPIQSTFLPFVLGLNGSESRYVTLADFKSNIGLNDGSTFTNSITGNAGSANYWSTTKVTDFNTQSGFALLEAADAGIPNQPTATGWGQGLQVSTNNNPDYVNQLVFDINGALSTRSKAGGVWNNWNQILTATTSNAIIRTGSGVGLNLTNTADADLQFEISGIGSPNKFAAISTSTANTPLVFQQFGSNVGVGTVTPQYKLDVAGDIASSNNIFIRGVNNTGVTFSNAGNTNAINSFDNGLDFYTGVNQYAKRFRIDGNGEATFNNNISINDGRLTTRGQSDAFRIVNGAGYISWYNDAYDTRLGYIQSNDANGGNMIIQSEAGNRSHIIGSAGGNILLGPSPDDLVNKLQVSGSIKSTSLAGTGDRPLVADANGVLKIGTGTTNDTTKANLVGGNNFSGTNVFRDEYYENGIGYYTTLDGVSVTINNNPAPNITKSNTIFDSGFRYSDGVSGQNFTISRPDVLTGAYTAKFQNKDITVAGLDDVEKKLSLTGGTVTGLTTFDGGLDARNASVLVPTVAQSVADNSAASTNFVKDYSKGGTYTPVITGVDGATVANVLNAHYIKVGNVVTVSGLIVMSATNPTGAFLYSVSLPEPSNLTNIDDLSGSASGILITGSIIVADTANKVATVQVNRNGSGNETTMSYTFTYKLK